MTLTASDDELILPKANGIGIEMLTDFESRVGVRGTVVTSTVLPSSRNGM